MRPTLLVASKLTPDDALAWAEYGAAQALCMLGVSFEACSAPELSGRPEIPLLIDPGRLMATRVPGRDMREPDSLGPTGAFLRVGGTVPGCRPGETLPWFGPPQPSAPSVALASEPSEVGLTCRLQCPLFVTIGLYLSRFSSSLSPVADGSFVRQIDRLWDDDLAGKWGGLPVVDGYLELLEGALVRLHEDLGVPYVRKWAHPVREGQVRTHGLVLTHDVDAVYAEPTFREAAQAHLEPGDEDPLQPASQAGNRWLNFRRWVDLEQSLSVKSAFFFLAPEPGLGYWCSPPYNVADPAVARAARRLAQLGWEVSVHQLGTDAQRLLDGERRQFEWAVGLPPTGTRSHYLKHEPHTPALKAVGGMVYDSTWYAETTESSFLCGTTLPFAPFGLAGPGGAADLWEFPFVIEDGIIFGAYGEVGRDVDGAVEDGRRALRQVLLHNGYACLNAHQRTFAGMSSYPGTPDDWTPAYEQLIRDFQHASPSLWCPLPRELAAWWGARECVEVRSLPKGVEVINRGPGPIGDLVLCTPVARSVGALWQRLTDGKDRKWAVRPAGLLRPGERRVLP